MTLKEVIQKDGQRHLHVKSAITSGTTQYMKYSKYRLANFLPLLSYPSTI